MYVLFKCTIDQLEQLGATSLRKFVTCVSNALARAGSGDEEDDESDPNEEISSEDDSGTGDDLIYPRLTTRQLPKKTPCLVQVLWRNPVVLLLAIEIDLI